MENNEIAANGMISENTENTENVEKEIQITTSTQKESQISDEE